MADIDKMGMTKPDISLIIPIYNQEKYIRECLLSILDNTHRNIEVIMVDDASTDGTYEIIRELVGEDTRFQLIRYERNLGTSQARKDAVLASSGRYIMFVDPDDTLVPSACERALSAIESEGVDILQFGTNVINCGVNPDAEARFERDSAPYPSRLEEDTLFFSCFDEGLFSFNLWNKIYEGDMARRAFSMVTDGYYPKAQDMYAFLLMSYYSHTYASIEERLYNYYFGRGITGKRTVPLARFSRITTQMHIIEELYKFIDTEAPEDHKRYTDVLRRRGNIFLGEILANYKWLENYDRTEREGMRHILDGIEPLRAPKAYKNPEIYKAYLDAFGAYVDRLYYDSGLGATDMVYDFMVGLITSDRISTSLSHLSREVIPTVKLHEDSRPIIPIVFATNNKYAPYLSVTLQSIIDHADDDYAYDVRIFHTGLGTQETMRLRSMSTDNVYVRCQSVLSYVGSIRDYSHSHYSHEMYYRILIPEILPEYDKVVYLDCDMVLEIDVMKLYKIDLKGNILAAVINDLDTEYMFSYLDKTLHMSPDEYFNSGMLLIDTKLFIERGIKEKCLSYLDSIARLQCPDQDILNLACRGSVLYLEKEWNFQIGSGVYSVRDKYLMDPFIIHYTSGVKPWNTPNLPLGERFFYYARRTPFFEDIIRTHLSLIVGSSVASRTSAAEPSEKKSIFTWPFRMVYKFFRSLGKHGFKKTMHKVDIKLKYVVNRLMGRVDKYNNPIIKEEEQAPAKELSTFEQLDSIPIDSYPKELERWYNERTGENMDIEAPRTFNHKIQWLKIHDARVIKSQLSDKWLAKEYIASTLGKEYIIPTLGVYDSFEDINFDGLPDRFVIKSTHGSGQVIVVRDKSKLDLADTKARIDRWLSKTYAYNCGFEMHYYNMIPRVIIEEYVDGVDGDLYDYKLMCVNGRVEFIWVDTDRYNGHRRNLYSRDWELLPVKYHHENSDKVIPRPERLREMIELSERLAEDFALVRCDFYVLPDGTLRFGELTFTSASGVDRWDPVSYDLTFGELLTLPEKTPFKKYTREELLALESDFLAKYSESK